MHSGSHHQENAQTNSQWKRQTSSGSFRLILMPRSRFPACPPRPARRLFSFLLISNWTQAILIWIHFTKKSWLAWRVLLPIPCRKVLTSCIVVVPATGSLTTLAIRLHTRNHMRREKQSEECWKEPQSANMNVLFLFSATTIIIKSFSYICRPCYIGNTKIGTTGQQVSHFPQWICYFGPI